MRTCVLLVAVVDDALAHVLVDVRAVVVRNNLPSNTAFFGLHLIFRRSRQHAHDQIPQFRALRMFGCFVTGQ